MDLASAIQNRRSVKRFTNRPVTREEIEELLAAATLAPNHRLTQPWRFYVLGPEARYAYGLVLGARKAKKLDDPERGRQLRDDVATEHRVLPCMLAVAMVKSADVQQMEEDFGATMMAIQNISLAAVGMGLGTHIKTGAIMDDPAARHAAGVGDDQRIVAIVNIGEPAELPSAKLREAAPKLTTWVP
jgi:nitroreductase